MPFSFKAIGPGFAGYEFTDTIFYNLKFFLDNGFIEAGGYENVQRGVASYFNTDDSILRPVFDERYNIRRVFNGLGKSWVWESGVSVPSGAVTPIRPSGVWVDNVFHSSSETGFFAHKIDYQRGRIIFDNAINESSVVQAEYTFRKVNVDFADDPDFRTLILQGQEQHLLGAFPSGEQPKDHQIHLPAVFIDMRNLSSVGLQLGGGQTITNTVLLHIFADHPSDRNHINDMLFKQNRTAFIMANFNNAQFPLDSDGDVVAGITNFTDIINNSPGHKLVGQSATSFKVDSANPGIFRSRVEMDVEIALGDI